MGDLMVVLTSLPFTPFIIAYYLFALVVVSLFIVIFFSDLRYGIIPDKILVLGIISTIIWLIYSNPSLLIPNTITALGSFLFFLVIFLLTRGRGIGFGDVKLGFFMGLLLGFPDILLALYLAFLTGGIVGIILILWKKKRMKSRIAFGPFLILGTFISFFFSPVLIPRIMDLLL